MTSLYLLQVTFVLFLIIALPSDLIHINKMETVGVVAFCHGFKITNEFFLYREIALCSLDGNHHILFSYSPGHDLSAFPDDIQTSIAEQTKTIHGLAYFDNAARDQELVVADVKNWYKTHCPSYCPAVGLVGITPLKDLFPAIHIPTVELSMDLNNIEELPIGTTNAEMTAMASTLFGTIIAP